MVDFLAMSGPEAKAYLQRFLGEMPASRERFAGLLQASGADPGLVADHSPDSLDPVWDAARPRLAWRPGYEPPAWGMPEPAGDAAVLSPPDELPSWFPHPSGVGFANFSRETLWIIDGASRHLAQVVLANAHGTTWVVGNRRRKGYIDQFQPVISGLRDDFNPVRTTGVLVVKTLRGGEQGPQSLRQLFNAWVPQV